MSGGRFSGKTCLITGGAAGIGRATAILFAREGATVVIGDVNEELGQGTTEEIESEGGRAIFVPTDVTRPDDIRRLVEEAAGSSGSLDVVFANAAVLDAAPLEETSVEQFERTMRANLLHPFLLIRDAAPHLRQAQGAVVLMSSTGGIRGIIGQSGYSSTKAGVINLTRVLAAELGPEVRVNCVCPGWVDTSFNDSIWNLLGRERESEFLARVPLRRQALPEEIASVVLFLASNDAAYVTGHALVVDGGMTAV